MGGLAILDPSTAPVGKLELADICELMGERLPLLPPMRWRLVEVPLGLDYPYWVEDEDFDLDFHVRGWHCLRRATASSLRSRWRGSWRGR